MNTNIENEEHPDLDGPLETAVWAVLSENVPTDAVDRVKLRAHDAMQSVDATADPGMLVIRRKVVRLMLPLIAVAASALLACSLLLTPSSTFAQVVERIKQIKTATFLVESTGGKRSPDFVAVATVERPDRLRFEFQSPGKTVNITNYADGELISYDANSDQVTVHEIHKAEAGFDILQQLQNAGAKAVVVSDENTIEGTNLYSIFDGRGRVWVDQKTKLPQRIEVTAPEGFGATKVVYRDFRWDVPVDDSLFKIPEGRTIVRNSLLADPTEAELVAAFQLRHAFNQDPYGATFWDDRVGLRLGRIAYDRSKSRAENAVLQKSKLGSHFAKIGISESESQDPAIVQKRIDYLCMKLDAWEHIISRKGGWVGNGVRPGETKALCWWKDAGQIRVLQANLTIVDAENPPVGE